MRLDGEDLWYVLAEDRPVPSLVILTFNLVNRGQGHHLRPTLENR